MSAVVTRHRTVETVEPMGRPVKTRAQVVHKPSAEQGQMGDFGRMRYILSRMLFSNPARKALGLLKIRFLGFEPNEISVRRK
jgi:hypothetical protein